MQSFVIVFHPGNDVLEFSLVLDLPEVLDDFLDNQEDGVFVLDQVIKLVDLRVVRKELTIERHALVGELVIRPVLLYDLVDY